MATFDPPLREKTILARVLPMDDDSRCYHGLAFVLRRTKAHVATGPTMDALLFTTTAVCLVIYRRIHQTGDDRLRQSLLAGTSLNAEERICIVDEANVPLPGGGRRADMRLYNLWHRATYILVQHQADHVGQHEDTYVLVQRRSVLKDYCPGKLDPTPGGVVGVDESYELNATRELEEEMGIKCQVERLFCFPYEDDLVRVWGGFFKAVYHGALKDLKIQKEEVDEVMRISLQELKGWIDHKPEDFMPDACHAMRLFFQFDRDMKVNRRLLKGYSSSNLDAYDLRPAPRALFFDCDDCLYFDGWTLAKKLTAKIDEWCVNHGLKPGQAYELYKQYGTALRGLLAEGYLDETEQAIDGFLRDVHDIGVDKLLKPDPELRRMLLQMDPAIPKYIFTASVAHHADRCLKALGIDDLFVGVIDCKLCDFESKHSHHSFRAAMQIVGVEEPESCLFLDDNLRNIEAARQIGWRCVLVGRVGRDCGSRVSSEHAEHEIDRIHELPSVWSELFPAIVLYE